MTDEVPIPPPDDLTSRVASKRHDYAVKAWHEANDGGATVSALPRSRDAVAVPVSGAGLSVKWNGCGCEGLVDQP